MAKKGTIFTGSIFDKEHSERSDSAIYLNRSILLEKIKSALEGSQMGSIRSQVQVLRSVVCSPKEDLYDLICKSDDDEAVPFKQAVLVSDLDQILGARTLQRAQYYLRRLEKGINGSRTSNVNDIDLNRWKEYEDVITDSLWVLDRRDKSGVHIGWYWGNFIPQIPHQLMLRYTKRRDWVVDAFVGSGTTLIECRRMGRNGIGVEISNKVAEVARKHSQEQENRHDIRTEVITADSRTADVSNILKEVGIKKFQLLIMHPPYHDIIQFTEDDRDLSNAPSVDSFLKMFGEVVDNFSPFLERKRYFGLVIGDKYSKGEWIPLGFRCMEEVLKRGFTLKSIVVKNFDFTRAKQNQAELWRYRAIVGGFYVFKHEYVMIFRKK